VAQSVRTRAAHRIAVAAVMLAMTGCIFSSLKVEPLPTRGGAAPQQISTPVKAHLTDGSTVVYRNGVLIRSDTVWGEGALFGLTQGDSSRVEWIPLDRVAAMESYSTRVEAAATIIGTAAATAAVSAGTVLLLKALFGSCPTIYADTGGALALQAELFSYSIAQRLEMPDADRLYVRPDASGRVALEVRNEALETHYINSLQLVEIRHHAGEVVVPDGQNRPLALSGFVPVTEVQDRLGSSLSEELALPDGRAFRSRERVVDEAVQGDLEDYLDITVPLPAGDSAAVVLRMRNSLLNTVLLYDVLLGGRGAQALRWIGSDLDSVGAMLQVAHWYASRMGMRVFVRERGAWRAAGRLPDTGPIAWKDVAAVVPVPRGEDSLRVRLSFVADNWRIDQVRVAGVVRRPEQRRLAPASVTGPDERPDSVALAAVSQPDARYLTTGPGQRFTVTWEAGPAPQGEERSFLLASRGYYIEWIRQAWLRDPPQVASGPPNDDLLRRALAAWRVRQPDFERRFEATRIPVR
jgi:hypothetical protein